MRYENDYFLYQRYKMDRRLIDGYSLLHFSVGIVAYYWGVPLIMWMLAHIIFEIIENTKTGRNIINTYFSMWPGGKPSADTFINSMIGDNLSTMLGWLIAYSVCCKKTRTSVL